MERLTSDGLTACAMCVGEELGCRPVVASGRYAHEKWEKMQNCHNRKVYDRLREYEKTGLTPEQITAIQREIEDGTLVRVVRCKDCNHANYEWSESNKNAVTRCCNLGIDGLQTGYCHYGERRKPE